MAAEENWDIAGQAEVWKRILSFAEGMAMNCVVEVGVPDIIYAKGRPISVSEIATCIPSESPQLNYLGRLMRFLANAKVFSVEYPQNGDLEPLYGLTDISRWLLRDSHMTLAPMLLFHLSSPSLFPWLRLGQCIKEGAGIPFQMANGLPLWEFTKKDAAYNKVFNAGMACVAPIMTRGILEGYKDGISSLRGTVVDVGGGSGAFMAEIVKLNDSVNAVNFDMVHVVEAAPKHKGVVHVGGNMFESIPEADAIILKSVLHDWGDQDCVKILMNCRKSIEKKSGKVIIVDMVIDLEGIADPFESIRLSVDLVMIAHCDGGKERTKNEWMRLLKKAGYERINMIKVPALSSIIEAYPIPSFIHMQ